MKAVTVFLLCLTFSLAMFAQQLEPTDPVPYGLGQQEWRNLQRMWRRKTNPVKIQLVNDSIVYGQILGVSEPAVFVWTDVQSFFNPYNVGKHLAMIEAASFIQMSDYYGFSPGWRNRNMALWTAGGAAFGAAFVIFVGQGWIPFYIALPPAALGTLTAHLINRKRLKNPDDKSEVVLNYAKISDGQINNYVVFPKGLPGAISFENGIVQFDSAAISQLTINEVLSRSPHAEHIFRTRPFSISGQFVQTLHSFNDDKKPTYYDPAFGLSARIRLAERLFTGYSYRSHYFSYDHSQYETIGQFDNYWLNNKSHLLFIQFAPINPDLFLTRRFEIAAGVGVSVNFIDFQSNNWENYNYIAENGDRWQETNFLHGEMIDKTNYGWLFLVDLGYYISRSLSLNANVEHSFVKELQIRQKTVSNPRTGEQVTIEPYRINPSVISYSLGIRLHF